MAGENLMFTNIVEENAFLVAISSATVAGSASSLNSPVECSLGCLLTVDSLSSSSLLDSVAVVPTDAEELRLKKRRIAGSLYRHSHMEF